jgi:hypothetical protein
MSLEEQAGMNYVYGKSLTNKIVKDVEVVSFTHGDRVSEYDRSTGKILLNAGFIPEIKMNLILVHESAHWVQDKVMGRQYGWGFSQPATNYMFAISDLSQPMGIEAEAELARTLSMWLVKSRGYLVNIHAPLVFTDNGRRIFANDSIDNRISLWQYMTKYLHVAPPGNWDEGL